MESLLLLLFVISVMYRVDGMIYTRQNNVHPELAASSVTVTMTTSARHCSMACRSGNCTVANYDLTTGECTLLKSEFCKPKMSDKAGLMALLPQSQGKWKSSPEA